VFLIKNESKRALEWEILQNNMVVEERENILPGFTAKLTATLAPGSYDMTCGLLSNPKGKLIAKAAVPVDAAAQKPDFGPVISAYKAYVADEVAQLTAKTKILVEAVKAGRLAEAQQAYAPAHLYYERIEPVAEVFDDLDKSMDSRAGDYELQEKDPNFAGFHRLEYGLFAGKSTAGLDAYADRLMANVLDLQARVEKLDITPKILAGGAAELIEEVASKKISGEEDRYSKTDLWDFQANVEGAQKIVALLRQHITARDPRLIAQIDSNFAKVDAGLARYRDSGGGFAGYDALTPADQKALKGPVTVLAEDLSKLRGTLGID
jgi:iron uptake system component EfeO